MKPIVVLFLFSATALKADAGDMLRKAIGDGDLKVMENLLSSGANPNQPDRRGETPLDLAMLVGRVPAVELLLTWHADPNAPLGGNGAGRSSETHFSLRFAPITCAWLQY
jgi:ankyrin repeat protein